MTLARLPCRVALAMLSVVLVHSKPPTLRAAGPPAPPAPAPPPAGVEPSNAPARPEKTPEKPSERTGGQLDKDRMRAEELLNGRTAQRASTSARLEVLEDRALVFSTPFGEGEDRHVGVRAASAVVRAGAGWLIAQDDSNFAALWTGETISPIRLFENHGAETYSEARGNKKQKPDLESGLRIPIGGQPSAVFFGSGSGSTELRRRAVIVSAEAPAAKPAQVVAIPSLYEAAMAALGIGPKELNLEAVCRVSNSVRFFQRGNRSDNASFDVSLRSLERALTDGAPIRPRDVRNVRHYDLGALDGPTGSLVGAAPRAPLASSPGEGSLSRASPARDPGAKLAFSAAASLPDGRVVFAASAEDSPSTVDDGAVAGSVLGIIDRNQRVIGVWPVPAGADGPPKIEGLAVEKLERGTAILVATTDADDPSRPSRAIRIRLSVD